MAEVNGGFQWAKYSERCGVCGEPSPCLYRGPECEAVGVDLLCQRCSANVRKLLEKWQPAVTVKVEAVSIEPDPRKRRCGTCAWTGPDDLKPLWSHSAPSSRWRFVLWAAIAAAGFVVGRWSVGPFLEVQCYQWYWLNSQKGQR